jgi:hypothetical protein
MENVRFNNQSNFTEKLMKQIESEYDQKENNYKGKRMTPII